jgi:protein TonB
VIDTVTKAGFEKSNREAIRTGSWRSWVLAGALALILNLVLFDLMPGLVDHNPDRPGFSDHINTVNVIRIKKPEKHTRKQKNQRPKDPFKKLTRQKRVQINRMEQVVDIPFELNSELPALAGALKVPPFEMISLNLQAPKGAYGVGEIDRPLIQLAQAPPIYPMRARRMGLEGWVRVRFIVSEDGQVRDAEVLESQPEQLFDRAVLRCVSAWRFTPGTVEGVAVNTSVETTVRFELE